MADTKNLAEAMALLQQTLPPLAMTRTVEVGGGKKAPYADLSAVSEAILPVLGKLGLSFVAAPTIVDGKFVLHCQLLHVDGGKIEALYPLTGTTQHQIGSAITYGRRYCLGAMTGLTPEDDDGGAAAQAASAPRTAQRAQRQERPTAQRAQPALPADDEAAKDKRAMFALFNELIPGKSTDPDIREQRLGYAATQAGRDITSSDDLTPDEVKRVVAALRRWGQQSEPQGETGDEVQP